MKVCSIYKGARTAKHNQPQTPPMGDCGRRVRCVSVVRRDLGTGASSPCPTADFGFSPLNPQTARQPEDGFSYTFRLQDYRLLFVAFRIRQDTEKKQTLHDSFSSASTTPGTSPRPGWRLLKRYRSLWNARCGIQMRQTGGCHVAMSVFDKLKCFRFR